MEIELITNAQYFGGFPKRLSGEESACSAGDRSSSPNLEDCPWRTAWQPSPVFLPGESHGQRSLAGYSPWGRRGSDTTERVGTHATFTEQHGGREDRRGEVIRPVEGGGLGEPRLLCRREGSKTQSCVRSLDCQFYKSRSVS